MVELTFETNDNLMYESPEELVNSIDEKILKCFGHNDKSIEDHVTPTIRTQEEIMNECQLWFTITENFGNILSIDWSKSFARQVHINTLKLNNVPDKNSNDVVNDLTSEDEAVANDLDMHALILNGFNTDSNNVQTAEEVIKEIDDILDDDVEETDDRVVESEAMEKAKEVLGSPFYEEKLKSHTIGQLNELYNEMEILVREYSETLISQLALRDELEYEKELKNSFISLLLGVQNRRRQMHVDKKRGKSNGPDPKYLTTVIPYHPDSTPPDNETLEILIKILTAINEDSQTVATLLTDYILKVLCPN